MISWIFKNFLQKNLSLLMEEVKFKEIFLTKFESITLKDITSFVMPTLLPKLRKLKISVPKFITKKNF